MKHRTHLGLTLLGLSISCAILAPLAWSMVIWYLGAALWVGAAAFFWQAARSLWGGAASRLPAGHTPDSPNLRPTAASHLPGIAPPDAGPRAAAERAEQKEFTDELHESVAGVFGIMKTVVVVCTIAVLGLIAQFSVLLGIWAFSRSSLLEGFFLFGFVGFLTWYGLGPLRKFWSPQSMLNQDGDDGGGGE
ncbi:hypothetical protein GCM10009551_019870 [Nocardiopsis tropica]